MGKEGFSYNRPTEEQALRNLERSSRPLRFVEPIEELKVFDPGSLRAARSERRQALRAIERERLGLMRTHGETAHQLPEFAGLTRRLRELQRDQHADRQFLNLVAYNYKLDRGK